MRLFRFALLIAALPMVARAQADDQKAVLAVVDKLFDGMRKADTALMRSLFVPQARMLGVGRQGEATSNSVDAWLNSIGQKRANLVYDERTWAPEAKVDGTIAQAWMQYAFYLGDKLSHCGVDAFDFLKVGSEWKIATVMDTRHDAATCKPAKNP